jgi:nitrite reductase/ring-hydroxylating ferredoxin subunit
LLERYARIRAWHDGDPGMRRQIGRHLLLAHPTGLREALEIDGDEADGRALAVRTELERVRAAAPLPPAEPGARALHALADLEPLMIELRRIRRGKAGRSHDLDAHWDPAWTAIEAELKTLAERPAAEHLGTVVAWLAARYALPGWWNRVWGDREAEVDIGPANDFPLDVPRRVEGPDGPLLVVRRSDGWRASSAECPHRGGDLAAGELEGEHVICPVHGWAFSLLDGTSPADPRCRLPLYDAREAGGRVLVRARPC